MFAGLVESKIVTCGLIDCTPGSALGPTLVKEYGRTLPFSDVITEKYIDKSLLAPIGKSSISFGLKSGHPTDTVLSNKMLHNNLLWRKQQCS